MDKQAMRRYRVESSNIDSVGHNFLTKNLEIEFKGGNIYRYKKVPRSVFKKMMGADSKGKFFWNNIRFDYPYKKYITKDGDKVKDNWKKLQRKEKDSMDGQEKVAMSNVAKSAIAGGAVGATGGAVRGAANTLLNERIPKKKKIKEALKAAAKQALVGGLAGAATGAVSPAMWNLLGGKGENKKASFELDTMYKEAGLSSSDMYYLSHNIYNQRPHSVSNKTIDYTGNKFPDTTVRILSDGLSDKKIPYTKKKLSYIQKIKLGDSGIRDFERMEQEKKIIAMLSYSSPETISKIKQMRAEADAFDSKYNNAYNSFMKKHSKTLRTIEKKQESDTPLSPYEEKINNIEADFYEGHRNHPKVEAHYNKLRDTANSAIQETFNNYYRAKALNKTACSFLDTMHKEAALSQSQKAKLIEGAIGAGVGSLAGAGIGALKAKSTSKKKNEDDASTKKRTKRDILIGALTGAGVGGAGSVAANKLARNKAKSNVAPGPSLSDIEKSRSDFLNRYEANRRKNYALVDGRSYFDKGGKDVRKAEINMFMNWSPEDPNVAKVHAIRSGVNRMRKVKDQLENETGAEFVSRLRDRKFYAYGAPRVEGVTYKNGRPIVGGHFDNEDYRTYLSLSRQRGAAQAEKNLIDNRLFGGFRKIDKAEVSKNADLAESIAKSNILADVDAIKKLTRQEYLDNKAKNVKKADRMIYHYSNLADKLEGRR